MQHHSNPSLCPNHWGPRSWSWPVLWRSRRPSRTNTKKRCSFYHRGLECKNRKLRDTSITGKFDLRIQNKAGLEKTVLSREHADQSKHTFPATWDNSTHGHQQMINTKIRLIVLFEAEDEKALYSHQKQDLELTMAQIISSFLQNSGLIWRK